MSGSEKTRSGLTRRGFLKTTGIAAGATALMGLSGCATAGSDQLATTSEGDSRQETICSGVCRPNCFAYCHLNVHVRDGKIVKTSRGSHYSDAYSRICQRGLSHVHRIYDPERVLYPLRRAEGTERGAGQWERISWDEAYADIAERIKDAQSKYGNSSVSFCGGSGNFSALTMNSWTRLCNIIQGTALGPCVDQASAYGLSRSTGKALLNGMVMSWEGNEPTDMRNAKTIIVWGANVTDAQIHNWHLIKEAMCDGVKLVVVDPTFTQIAAKSDMWVPIRPGSDTLLKLALMNEIIEREEVDVDFMTNHTVGPFLVRSDTQAFLRLSDIDEAVAAAKAEYMASLPKDPKLAAAAKPFDDPYMVLVDGQPVALEEGVVPQLEGKADVAGVSCTTAYSLLLEHLKQYDVESVSQLTEVPVETIKELATICIDGPVFHYEGYGPQAFDNGVATTTAGVTLCALTGNLGKNGASYGSFWGLYIGLNGEFSAPTGPNPNPTVPSLDFSNVVRSGQFGDVPLTPKVLFIYFANIVNTSVDENVWIDTIIPNLDYVVTIDSAMTDTCLYSDLVLPCAQWFEVNDVAIAGQTVALEYNERAIDPLGESKSDWDIVCGIGEALGVGEHFAMSEEEALEALFDSPMGQKLGVSFAKIKEEQVMRLPEGDPVTDPHVAWKDGVFTTPHQRLAFYQEKPNVRSATTKTPSDEETDRERLPTFYPPREAWPENELHQTYPFVCMSERPRYRVHSQWFSTPLLRELDPEPYVKMNPGDAQERGIEDGVYVECFNDRGSAVAKVVLSEAVRRGTLVYPKSWQKSQHKLGGWSELTSEEFNTFAVNCNFMDVLCDIRTWDGE